MGVVKKSYHGGKIKTLSQDEIEKGNERCKKTLHFPITCSGFTGDIFTTPKVALKNTHGWTEYTANRIWIYLLKDSLEVKQRRSLFFFFDVMARTHARKFNEEELDTLEKDVDIALVLLERDCTIYLSNITTHILKHLVTKIRDNGPLYAFWMYSNERMNSWITRRVLNRSKMEECVMETVQVSLNRS
ncbi:uncharacterized protein [Clytia hemisphaerica]|uniref:uncharacterized protein n=1 Tax=Clytia hemisphaerica TaxID=252671 RepID=UPI0034D58BC9